MTILRAGFSSHVGHESDFVVLLPKPDICSRTIVERDCFDTPTASRDGKQAKSFSVRGRVDSSGIASHDITRSEVVQLMSAAMQHPTDEPSAFSLRPSKCQVGIWRKDFGARPILGVFCGHTLGPMAQNIPISSPPSRALSHSHTDTCVSPYPRTCIVGCTHVHFRFSLPSLRYGLSGNYKTVPEPSLAKKMAASRSHMYYLNR